MTPPDTPAELLRRIASGGVPKTDQERESLSRLSILLNRQNRLHACPACVIRRAAEEFTKGRSDE